MNTQGEINDTYLIELRGGMNPSNRLIAFRTGRRAGRNGRKVLHCPTPGCAGILTHIDEDTKVEIVRQPGRSETVCHEYVTCRKCDKEIGIRFV